MRALQFALARLRQTFSPRRYRIGANGLRALNAEGSSRNADVIVGRELCLFLYVNASSVPVKQRAGFAELAVRRAAPFADPLHDAVWRDGHASIWFWSEARVQPALGALGASRVRYSSEARFIGTAHQDGIESLAVGDGVQFRVWRAGRVIADRWMSEIPQGQEWSRFLRGSGIAADVDMPPVVGSTLATRAWDTEAIGPMRGMLGHWSAREWLSLPVLATVLLSGWLLGGIVRNALEVRRLSSEVDTLTRSAGEILDAQASADEARRRIEAILALRPAARPASTVAALASSLAEQDWRLRNISVDQSGLMSATLDLKTVNPAELVSAMEATGVFSNASVEIVPNSTQVILRARATMGNHGGGTATAELTR